MTATLAAILVRPNVKVKAFVFVGKKKKVFVFVGVAKDETRKKTPTVTFLVLM